LAANESNINRTYLSAVECSERNVSIDNVARIAKGFKCEPWKLQPVDLAAWHYKVMENAPYQIQTQRVTAWILCAEMINDKIFYRDYMDV